MEFLQDLQTVCYLNSVLVCSLFRPPQKAFTNQRHLLHCSCHTLTCYPVYIIWIPLSHIKCPSGSDALWTSTHLLLSVVFCFLLVMAFGKIIFLWLRESISAKFFSNQSLKRFLTLLFFLSLANTKGNKRSRTRTDSYSAGQSVGECCRLCPPFVQGISRIVQALSLPLEGMT